MSAGSSHAQVRCRNGRFAAGDPGVMELQDANEDGTAAHMDLRKLVDAMRLVDAQQDLSSAERGVLLGTLERVIGEMQQIRAMLRRQHLRDRKLNSAMDHLREEVAVLNEAQLELHRHMGGRGCQLQSERQRARHLANVVIHQNNGRVEVNPT